MIIHYRTRHHYGHIAGTGSRGFSDDGFGRVVLFPREGKRPLEFVSRQAAIDWLKANVPPDTVIADTEAEFRASKVPTVYIEPFTYPGPHFIFPVGAP